MAQFALLVVGTGGGAQKRPAGPLAISPPVGDPRDLRRDEFGDEARSAII